MILFDIYIFIVKAYLFPVPMSVRLYVSNRYYIKLLILLVILELTNGKICVKILFSVCRTANKILHFFHILYAFFILFVKYIIYLTSTILYANVCV